MRTPTLDEIEQLFCERWEESDRDLRLCLAAVRDAILVGSVRARVRARISDRQRRRQAPASYRDLAESDAIVLRRIARAGGLEVRHLIGHDNSRTVSRWRSAAMWVLCKVRERSPTEAGAVLNRNHSTVLYGVSRVEERIREEPALARKLRRLGA